MFAININSNGPSTLNKHGLTSIKGLTFIYEYPSKTTLGSQRLTWRANSEQDWFQYHDPRSPSCETFEWRAGSAKTKYGHISQRSYNVCHGVSCIWVHVDIECLGLLQGPSHHLHWGSCAHFCRPSRWASNHSLRAWSPAIIRAMWLFRPWLWIHNGQCYISASHVPCSWVGKNLRWMILQLRFFQLYHGKASLPHQKLLGFIQYTCSLCSIKKIWKTKKHQNCPFFSRWR